LHNDPYHNILAQVVGRKYLRLYDMKLTGNMYPRDGFQCNNSSVDIDDVDGERYPLFSTTSSFQCVLERGEMLYIPRHFWHYVRSLDVSFSVSFWYGAKMGLVKNDTSGEYEAVYS
jgi:ribosomal protein L16 Arg81 hydroxylase